MRKIILLLLMMCCFISMTACSKDEIIEQYNQALQALPDTGLTDKKELQGKRSPGTDSYVGTYEANYEDFSGEEVLFGGTALERDGGNEIEISCHMDTESGTLKLILQTGADEPEILCDTEDSYSGTIDLPSASNYITVEAENYTGTLELTVQ